MCHQHCQSQHFAGPFASTEFLGVQQIMDRHEVAFGLGHFPAFDLEIAIVHPDFCHPVGIMGAAGLGDLVFMMRKDQIQPASVNVKRFTQMVFRHHRAFNMPTRDARGWFHR